MKVIHVESLYSDYWLYNIMYGCKPYQRSREAALISDALEAIRSSVVPHDRPLQVLELFSGKHTLLRSLQSYGSRFNQPTNYVTVDGLHSEDGELPQFDAYAPGMASILDGRWYDFVLLPFFAINATGPLHGSHCSIPDIDELKTLFQNVATLCGVNSSKKKSAFKKAKQQSALYVNYEPYPTPEIIEDLCLDSTEWSSQYLQSDDPLLTEHGIKDKDDCTWLLEYRGVNSWLRESSVLETRYPDGIRLINKSHSDKPVVVFQISQPVFRKFWTEGQIASALKTSGFYDIRFCSGVNQPIVGGDCDLLMYYLNGVETADTVNSESINAEFMLSNYLTALI